VFYVAVLCTPSFACVLCCSIVQQLFSAGGMNGVALLKLLTLLLLEEGKRTWGRIGRKWKVMMGQIYCPTLLIWCHWRKDVWNGPCFHVI